MHCCFTLAIIPNLYLWQVCCEDNKNSIFLNSFHRLRWHIVPEFITSGIIIGVTVLVDMADYEIFSFINWTQATRTFLQQELKNLSNIVFFFTNHPLATNGSWWRCVADLVPPFGMNHLSFNWSVTSDKAKMIQFFT